MSEEIVYQEDARCGDCGKIDACEFGGVLLCESCHAIRGSACSGTPAAED